MLFRSILKWTGIHKSELAKKKARERIRDMLPNRLEDKGIEDYLVGRKPIGTGSAASSIGNLIAHISGQIVSGPPSPLQMLF